MRHGDSKTEFSTGATRDETGNKGRPSLISAAMIYRIGRHLASGEKHYGKENWVKGMPYCRTADSIIRHIYLWLAGDNEEDHLAAIGCNIMFLMHFEDAVPESEGRHPLDDRCRRFAEILPSLLTSACGDAMIESDARNSEGPQCSLHRTEDGGIRHGPR